MGINIFPALSWKREGERESEKQKGLGRGQRKKDDCKKKKEGKILMWIYKNYRTLKIVSTSFLAWLFLCYHEVSASICEKLGLLAS